MPSRDTVRPDRPASPNDFAKESRSMTRRFTLAVWMVLAGSLAVPAADGPKETPAGPPLFRAPRRPAVPAVKNKAWVANPIDAFVLAELEGKGLSPNPRADKLRLLRRLTYDLTGLPPTV